MTESDLAMRRNSLMTELLEHIIGDFLLRFRH